MGESGRRRTSDLRGIHRARCEIQPVSRNCVQVTVISRVFRRLVVVFCVPGSTSTAFHALPLRRPMHFAGRALPGVRIPVSSKCSSFGARWVTLAVAALYVSEAGDFRSVAVSGRWFECFYHGRLVVSQCPRSLDEPWGRN